MYMCLKIIMNNVQLMSIIYNKKCDTYRLSKKKWPILYSILLYKIGHYFLDTQYDINHGENGWKLAAKAWLTSGHSSLEQVACERRERYTHEIESETNDDHETQARTEEFRRGEGEGGRFQKKKNRKTLCLLYIFKWQIYI